MELKYLVVKCNELSDQYECDCDRIPVCVTDERGVEEYHQRWGYEIYSILSDGKLKKIRDYDEVKSGCAVYLWNHDDDRITMLKELDIERVEDISLKQVKEIKERFGFKQSAQEIFDDCKKYGLYLENELTIGEYMGDISIY